MIRRLLAILLVAALGTLCARAQSTHVTFERIKAPGIADRVGAIVQDHQGFLWFVASGNLVRYDGYSFETHSFDIFRGSESPEQYEAIPDLSVGSDGMLWVSSTLGLYRFDPRTEEVISYRHDASNPKSLSSDHVWTTIEDREGILWVGTEVGLDRFDPETGIFTHYRHDPDDPSSISPGWVWRLFIDDSGTLWAGAGVTDPPFVGGLSRFNAETETFARFEADPEDESALIHPVVTTIDEDSRGVFWVGTGGGGLHTMDRVQGTFTRHRYDPEHPTRLGQPHVSTIPLEWAKFVTLRFVHEDHQGLVWIGTWGGGMNLYDVENDVISHYQSNLDDPNGLSTDRIWTLAESHDGTIWIGGLADSGLEGLHKAVRVTPFDLFAPDSTKSILNTVSAVHESKDGTLWVGTLRSGLIRIDRTTGETKRYQHDPASETGFPRNHIRSIQETDDGLLWLGGNEQGLDLFDPVTETFKRFQHDNTDPRSLAKKGIRVVYLDNGGRLWIGTRWNGLVHFDPQTRDLIYYGTQPNDPRSLSHNWVSAIYQSSNGSLWVGTEDGLNRFDRETESFERFLTGHPERGTVSGIAERTDGQLWVGWLDGTLIRLDPESGAIVHIDTRNAGLPGGEIGAMLVDDAGRLWVRSKDAITRFDEADNRFYSYPPGQGEDLAGSGYAAYKSATGELFFGGPHVIHAFYPDEILATENTAPPLVALTGFNLADEAVEPGGDSALRHPIALAKEIRLPHDADIFSFQFAALHYLEPSRNRHLYMLDGYDHDWREAGPDRTAAYYKVPPGDYRFRVKAANPYGVWSEGEATISLIVLPPWWQTWWAYTVYVLVLGALLTTIYTVRTRNLRKRADELAGLVDERTRALQEEKAKTEEQAKRLIELDTLKDRFFFNISHEFRTPLTLILGPIEDALDGLYGDISSSMYKHLLVMRRNGRRLHKLISQLLDLSRLEVGRMPLKAQRHNLVRFVRFIVLSFSSLAERRGIALTFESEQDDLPVYFDADKLEHVIGNLLANAFKFTSKDGKILVRLEGSSEDGRRFALISVADSGDGISEADLPFIFDRFHQAEKSRHRAGEGAGIGLSLADELIRLHHGRIEVESEVGVGTTFFVRIPMGVDHLSPDELAVEPIEEQADGDPYDVETLEVEADRFESDTLEIGEGAPSNAPTVLIVDDNEDVREYLKSHLRGRYNVLEAVNGSEGLEKARDEKPDLVLADVMMPEMDGYELCRTIKNDASMSHIPVVLLTARASDQAEIEGLEVGADDYVYKPFNAEALLARVENLIEIRRLLRERFSKEVTIAPIGSTVESADALFLERVRDAAEAHLGDSQFTVDWLGQEVGISVRQLRRKLQKLVNLSPGGYIRMIRLERAAQLFEQRAGNVSEVAYRVGFNDVRYFSKLFRNTFGVNPSVYAETGTTADDP